MRIAISATNPCHLYDMARELARAGALGCYYSGYPRWRLPRSGGMEIRTHSVRTLVTYGLLKFVPEKMRPANRALFAWQDEGFDRRVGRNLEGADFIHAMPGQCLRTFRAARRLGIRTVLNHATGPAREWVKIMEPEYARAELKLAEVTMYDDAYFAREREEYELADFHCAASTLVRDQLVASGIDSSRIWVVPYGADESVFHSCDARPARGFRIVFAGQLGLRKGLRTLLDALALAGRGEWCVDFYGARLAEAERDLAAYRGATPLHLHGAVPQAQLAQVFREASVLVLPSLEEGFGLVVVQALACGLPVIVSDRVGAKDLVRHRENGSVSPVQDAGSLAAELLWHSQNPIRVGGSFGWQAPAARLISHSAAALE